MSGKIAVVFIHHCNSGCPNFYHNYEDHENIWCGMLNKMVYKGGACDMVWNDFTKRPIPDECPLEDIKKE